MFRSILNKLRLTIPGLKRPGLLIVAATLGCLSAPALAQTRLVVIGDSNVEGRAVGPQMNYTGQLQRLLQQRGRNVEVVNRGISGDTIPGVLARLDRDVPAGTDAAVVWIGVNDYRRGATMDQIRAGHAAITSRLAARGIRSYVIAPPVYNLELHRNAATRVSMFDPHMNAAGYAEMLRRTYPQIDRLVAGKRKARTEARASR